VKVEFLSTGINAAVITVVGLIVGRLLNARMDRLEREVGALRTDLRGELREAIGSVREEIGSVRGEIGSVRGEIGSVRGELRSEIGTVRNEIGGLRAEMNERFARLEDRMDRGFDSVRSDLTRVALAVGARPEPDAESG
jgi:chromosome segregation ATPase